MNRPAAVTLRPARAADAARIAQLSRTLIEHGLAWRYTPGRVAALLADAETTAVVAALPEQAAQVRGFGVLQLGDTTAHLVLLCVQERLQRSGVGMRLMQWLLRTARVAGMESVRLELRADNAAALAFYGQLGFAESALLAGYYDGAIAARRMVLALRNDTGAQ